MVKGYFVQVVQRDIPGQGLKFLLECVYLGSVEATGVWNKFQTFTTDGGYGVAFRNYHADLQGFVSRYYVPTVNPLAEYLVAEYQSLTQFTNFRLDSGSLFPTEYELLELDFDTGDMNPDNYSPKLVDEASITNFSDETALG